MVLFLHHWVIITMLCIFTSQSDSEEEDERLLIKRSLGTFTRNVTVTIDCYVSFANRFNNFFRFEPSFFVSDDEVNAFTKKLTAKLQLAQSFCSSRKKP